MKISTISSALIIGAAGALLAACSGLQPPIGAPGAMPQALFPESSGEDLLYVAHEYSQNISVYSYPTGTLVGSISDAPYNAEGDCVDASGNVYIVNFDTMSEQPGNVEEFAHGGTSPLRTFAWPHAFLSGCAVDPVTGNLAVTIMEEHPKGYGGVLVYADATGSPTEYGDSKMGDYAYCSYDNAGNLFIDGVNRKTGNYELAELPYGQKKLINISLSKHLQKLLTPGGVQWDGKYLVLGNARTVRGDRVRFGVYQVEISGSVAKVVGVTLLKGSHNVRNFQYWIYGSTIISPFGRRSTKFGFWTYPQGDLTLSVLDTQGPWALTVSPATSPHKFSR